VKVNLPPEKNGQIRLDTILHIFEWMKIKDVDIDEVECIAANLIYNGFIKGYVHHQHRCLVVALKPGEAFPALSTVKRGK